MNVLEDTLNEIYNNFQNLNNQINNKNVSLENLENVIHSLDKYDNQLKNIYNMINSINNIKDHLKLLYSNKLTNIKNMSIKNTPKDNFKFDYTIDLVNVTNNEKYKTKKYCKCPVISITEDAISNMINTPIYLIKETNEYCIKINNKVIKGNIGNILNDKNQKKIKKCNRLYCNQKYYSKKECKFYHEGKDTRNFPNYSWAPVMKNKLGKSQFYNNNIISKSYDLENTRFLGSVDTLLEDLALTNNYEKKLRNNQLMHDLLLYQILDQYLE
jgi:hypothetical protein